MQTELDTLTFTPAQRQRLQVIISTWMEMLACDPTLQEPEDEELLRIIGTEERAEAEAVN